MKGSKRTLLALCTGWWLAQTACSAAKTVEPPKTEKEKPPAKSTKAIKEKSLSLVKEIMDRRPFKSIGEFESLLGTKLFNFDVCEFHSDQRPNSEIEGIVIFADDSYAQPQLADIVKSATGTPGPIEIFFNDQNKITLKDVTAAFGNQFSSKSYFGIPTDRTGLRTKLICYADKNGFVEFEFFEKSPARLHRVVISDNDFTSAKIGIDEDARQLYEYIENIKHSSPVSQTKVSAITGMALVGKRGSEFTSPSNPFGLLTRARAKASGTALEAYPSMKTNLSTNVVTSHNYTLQNWLQQMRAQPINDIVLDLNRNCKFTPEILHAIYGNPSEVYTMKHENADVCERDVYIYKQDDLTLTFKFRQVSKGKWQGESICFHRESSVKLP